MLFSEDERDLVLSALVDTCGNNLPLLADSTPTDLERVRFAVLKLSGGDLRKLSSAIALAQADWRDLLVCAGFADEMNAHIVWATT
jgi:dihydrodipicolinate synthase/N-acetylneuraminate lyase